MLRAIFALSLMTMPGLADTRTDSPLAVVPRTVAEAARIAAVVAATRDFTKPEPFEAKPAGAATVRIRPGPDVFSQYSANMPFDRQMDFDLGNALFTKTWVAAPASTLASDGLGPLFNAGGCQDCHLKDGRGHVPAPAKGPVSLFLRLSVPGEPVPADITDWIATIPEPTYGAQLQTFSPTSVPAEGRMTVTYTERTLQMNGETASLRVPTYAISDRLTAPCNPT